MSNTHPRLKMFGELFKAIASMFKGKPPRMCFDCKVGHLKPVRRVKEGGPRVWEYVCSNCGKTHWYDKD